MFANLARVGQQAVARLVSIGALELLRQNADGGETVGHARVFGKILRGELTKLR